MILNRFFSVTFEDVWLIGHFLVLGWGTIESDSFYILIATFIGEKHTMLHSMPCSIQQLQQFYFSGKIFHSAQEQRLTLEKVYWHLKSLKTETLWGSTFHCSSTITGTQSCLAALQLGEAISLLHPSDALKAIWLLFSAGISPQVGSRVSDENSIGEENKWPMMGEGQRWLCVNYLLDQSRRWKWHLTVPGSLQMH